MPSPADPVAFTLFGISVRWYAIFILTGIVVAVVVARALAIRRGLDPDFALDAAPWIVFAGIVGARLYYVLLRVSIISSPIQRKRSISALAA